MNLGGELEVPGAIIVQHARIGGSLELAQEVAVDVARQSGNAVVRAHGDQLPFLTNAIDTVVTNGVPIDRAAGHFGRAFTSSEIFRILKSPRGWVGSSSPTGQHFGRPPGVP